MSNGLALLKASEQIRASSLLVKYYDNVDKWSLRVASSSHGFSRGHRNSQQKVMSQHMSEKPWYCEAGAYSDLYETIRAKILRGENSLALLEACFDSSVRFGFHISRLRGSSASLGFKS